MQNYLIALLFTMFAMFGTAHAAVSEGVTAAITTAATDGATVAAAVLLVFLGIRAVKWLRSAL